MLQTAIPLTVVLSPVDRLLLGRPLQPFVPQTTFLSLIATGRQHTIASKGWLCFEARPAGVHVLSMLANHIVCRPACTNGSSSTTEAIGFLSRRTGSGA
jgi:hypothetical protein